MWIKKYFRQLRLSLIIVPAVAVTFVSLFALASAATDVVASSQPGDLLYPLQRPALDLKETLTQNPETPSRIELTPESSGLVREKPVAIDSVIIQGSQVGDHIGGGGDGNDSDNLNSGPEDGFESETAGASIQFFSNDNGEDAGREDDAEFKDDFNHNNGEGSDQNHDAGDGVENDHEDNSGIGNENDADDDSDRGDGDDTNVNGNDDDNSGDGDLDSSGPGGGNDDDNSGSGGNDDNSGSGGNDDNSGSGGNDDNSGSGSGSDSDSDDNSGSGKGKDDDEEKDKG